MIVFGKRNLHELLNQAPDPGVSIYLPTHRAGREVQQGPIRLKNLLAAAERLLADQGYKSAQITELLRPALELVDDAMFWQVQRDGLAVFLAPGFSRAYRLPLRFPERVYVSPRFYIKPLLPMLTEEGHYFVLALSLKEARLLVGTRDSLEQLELEGAPAGMANVVRDRATTHHSSSAGGHGGAILHGGGSADEDQPEELKRYFREVDAAVMRVLQNEHAPLVLAAVESHLPVYHEISDYPQVLGDSITGNPDELSLADLHSRTWSIVRPRFARAMLSATEKFNRQLGTGQASGQLNVILRAAFNGQIDFLFVPTGVQQWGRWDVNGAELELHPEPTNHSQDLLDLACDQTLRHGGMVFALSPDSMPQGCQIAAGFRY